MFSLGFLSYLLGASPANQAVILGFLYVLCELLLALNVKFSRFGCLRGTFNVERQIRLRSYILLLFFRFWFQLGHHVVWLIMQDAKRSRCQRRLYLTHGNLLVDAIDYGNIALVRLWAWHTLFYLIHIWVCFSYFNGSSRERVVDVLVLPRAWFLVLCDFFDHGFQLFGLFLRHFDNGIDCHNIGLGDILLLLQLTFGAVLVSLKQEILYFFFLVPTFIIPRNLLKWFASLGYQVRLIFY